MSSSSSIELRNIDQRLVCSSRSKLKTYGFVIAMIIGIIGLAVGAAGLARYFHIGTLSTMAHSDAIIMMAGGFGGGIILLIIGVIGTIRNRQPHNIGPNSSKVIKKDGSISLASSVGTSSVSTSSPVSFSSSGPSVISVTSSSLITSSMTSSIAESFSSSSPGSSSLSSFSDSSSSSSSVSSGLSLSGPSESWVRVDSVHSSDATHTLIETEHAAIIKSIHTQGGLVYGSEAWKIWNIEVLDSIPPRPDVDLSDGNRILLYIPQRIKIGDNVQDLTLKVLEQISGNSFAYLHGAVEQELGDKPARSGWVLIDKNVLPRSRGKNYDVQKRIVEEQGGSMPHVMEVVVLNLMVFAFTKERLYGMKEPCTYTRCIEKIRECPVIIGGFGPAGLRIAIEAWTSDFCGVARVQREFSKKLS